MRLCLLASLYPPDTLGGAEVYVRALARQLAEQHDVSVITTQAYRGRASLRPRLEQDGPVRVYRFFPLNFYHLSLRPAAWFAKAGWRAIDLYNWHSRLVVGRLLDRLQPDLVHSHNLRGLSISVWDAVRGRGLPLVHTLHDFNLLCRTSLLWHPPGQPCDGRSGVCRVYRTVMRGLAGSKPALVLSPSNFALEQHLRAGLFAGSQTAHLPLGVAPPAGAAQASHGPPPSVQPGPLQVLYFGVVGEHKGVRQLIQAFRLLPGAGARLEIAGNGTPREMAICRALAGPDPRIAFLGFLDGDQKEQAFQRASVVAVPTLSPDNYPVTILESLVRAKPVVASRVGGIPELIQPEVNGLLVEPGEVPALAAALDRLARDGALLARLGSAPSGQSIMQHALALSDRYAALAA